MKTSRSDIAKVLYDTNRISNFISGKCENPSLKIVVRHSPNMLLKTYWAGKGDSFLLQWQHDNKSHSILIDAGIPNTYRFIKAEIIDGLNLDFIIITHVDYDHLGGLFKLLNDKDTKLSEDFYVYMNTPSLVLTPAPDDKTNIEHGIQLDKLLSDLGIEVLPLYCYPYSQNRIAINGLEITIISPQQEVLQKFIDEWEANELYRKHLSESASSDKTSNDFSEKESYEKIIGAKEESHDWKNDLINSSSIAFIASIGSCSILFLGDSNPNLVYQELSRIGYTEKNKLSVALVKLSHHGSKFNTNKNLLSIIDCKNYLISGNGTGNNYHPDRETIVRLAAYGRIDMEQRLNIFLNYDLDRTRFITPDEEVLWNLHFEFKQIFEFKECVCYQPN